LVIQHCTGCASCKAMASKDTQKHSLPQLDVTEVS
jgi:multimeric flavodoxin WrbA